MQRTFPAPNCKANTRGFTFLEVLIALLIVTMTIGITASAAVQIIHSEQAARELSDAALHLQTLVCRTYLHDEEDRSVDGSLSVGWQSSREERFTVKNKRETAWITWSIRPGVGRSAGSYTVTLRSRATPWM